MQHSIPAVVAAYAVGGMAALAAQRDTGAIKLLNQMKDA
jgi:hypothetical protein